MLPKVPLTESCKDRTQLRSDTYGSGGLVGERSYAEAVRANDSLLGEKLPDREIVEAHVEVQQGVGGVKSAEGSPRLVDQQERISCDIEANQMAHSIIEAQQLSCAGGSEAMGQDTCSAGARGAIMECGVLGPNEREVMGLDSIHDDELVEHNCGARLHVQDLHNESDSDLHGPVDGSFQQQKKEISMGANSTSRDDVDVTPKELVMELHSATLCDVPIAMVNEWNYASLEPRGLNCNKDSSQPKRKRGRPRKQPRPPVQDYEPESNLNASRLLLEKTPFEVANTVWQMGLELGIASSVDDLEMLKRLEEMETRDRIAIGRNGVER
ncbi:hypothetical protein SESBI_42751 [Sesbania bispinosa]|nr:hypothetical protein SESBI_42751 [Sesbania bispinosa]